MRRASVVAAFAFHTLTLTLALPCVAAQTSLPTASATDRAEARAIFKQLIEINTTDSSGEY